MQLAQQVVIWSVSKPRQPRKGGCMEKILENKVGYIYALRAPDGEIRYVGKTAAGTIEERLAGHMKDSKRGRAKNQQVYNWIRTLVNKGQLPTVTLLEGEITVPEILQPEGLPRRWDQAI